MKNQFEVDVRSANGETLLALCGDIDAYTGPRLTEYLDAAVTGTEGDVRLNLAKVSFIDSSGIAVFVAAAKRLRERGSELVVEAAPSTVSKMFEMTGVTKLVRVDR